MSGPRKGRNLAVRLPRSTDDVGGLRRHPRAILERSPSERRSTAESKRQANMPSPLRAPWSWEVPRRSSTRTLRAAAPSSRADPG
jgi:hypothetical protein